MLTDDEKKKLEPDILYAPVYGLRKTNLSLTAFYFFLTRQAISTSLITPFGMKYKIVEDLSIITL